MDACLNTLYLCIYEILPLFAEKHFHSCVSTVNTAFINNLLA